MKLVKIRSLSTQNRTAKSRLAAICSASGLVLSGSHWIVLADEENHIGLFPRNSKQPGRLQKVLDGKLATDLILRKKQKADLESVCVTPLGLLLVPSGSKPNRVLGCLVPVKSVLEPTTKTRNKTSKIDFAKLYSYLELHFEELNIEGAVLFKDYLVLAQRGNGKSGKNALVKLRWSQVQKSLQNKSRLTEKSVVKISHVDLPKIKNVRYGLTDLCSLKTRLFFTAAAESGEDTYHDGKCFGSIVGELSPTGKLLWFKKVSSTKKFEGVWVESSKYKLIFYLVNDDDNPIKPAWLSSVTLPEPLVRSRVGARKPEVEEPLLGPGLQLFRSEALLKVEFDIAAEPKALLPADLGKLVQKYGSFKASAQVLGISEAFVRQNAREKRYSNKRQKS